MLRKIVKNNQSIHAVIHKPLTHRTPRKRREILRSGRVRGVGRNNNRVGQCPRLLQHRQSACETGVLLPNRHVDRVHWTESLIPQLFRKLIDPSLIDNRVDRHGCFSRRTIPNDQLPLSSPDRNHRIDRQNPRLQRLIDRLTFNNPRRDFFYGIRFLRLDRSLAIQRLAQRIHHTPE